MNTEKKMSRRDALKRMGAAVMGGAIASTGVLTATACQPRAKRRVVLYFTGTGNCLYVARQLAGKDGETLSIPQLMKNKRMDIEADEIGLVYPIYGHMPPNMVRRFIQKAHLKAPYLFAVLTYGNRKCSAVEIWDDVARRAGKAFHYIATLQMVDNWLPNFDMNEQMKIDKHIPEHLGKIQADVDKQLRWHEPVTEEERQQHQGFMAFARIDPEVGFVMKSEQAFTVTGACIECGVCTYVCPRGNYELTAKGPKIEGDCEYCFACIQNCPQKAILFAKKDDGSFPDGSEVNPNARYRNEHVSLWDLKQANNQKI